ncbi:MAG: acyltransferase [Thermoguttaceae bacterium]|jgi:acetyltransferase-like isoleucine patch superfamily enzyme
MSILLKAYYKLRRRPVPYYAEHPLWLLLWKPWRKFLNVVIIPSIPFNCLRILLYRLIGFKIGRHVFIGMRCYLDDVDPGKTTIEDNVQISYGCYFAVHGTQQGHTSIVIQEGTYVGMRAIVISGKNGIVIGRNCTVSAGALVHQSLPDGSTAAAVPARVIVAPPKGPP